MEPKTTHRVLIDPQPVPVNPRSSVLPGLFRQGDYAWRGKDDPANCSTVSCKPNGPDGWAEENSPYKVGEIIELEGRYEITAVRIEQEQGSSADAFFWVYDIKPVVDQVVTKLPTELHLPFGAKLGDTQIKWYTNARDIYTSLTEGMVKEILADPEHAGVTREDFSESGWLLDDGSEASDAEMLTALEALGYWGFADSSNTIHIWPGSLEASELAMLIGHEIGHLVEGRLEDDNEEEKRADTYGLVAKRVVEMLSERPF